MWFRRASSGGEDSEKALADANKNLQEIQRRGPEVTEVSRSLKEIHDRNHFAEALELIIGRHGGPLDTRH